MNWHINNKGEPGQCQAKKSCPFGDLITEHYGTKEAAAEGYEEKQKNSAIPRARKGPVVGGHYYDERDIVDGRPGRWNTRVTTGFGITATPTFFADDAGIQDDPSIIPNSFEEDSGWEKIARPAIDKGVLWGLQDAQRKFVENVNMENRPYGDKPLWEGKVSQYADEFVGRYLNGERSKISYDLYNRNFKQISPKEMFYLHMTGSADDQDGFGEKGVYYNGLVFPDKDLQPVLDRLNVQNVSVVPMDNSREQGLVYTVITPDGNSRSFSVYQHRNSDSIIVNGTTNWDSVNKSYGPFSEDNSGKESKNNFFAEFSYDTPQRQIAETVGYFLKSAQDGTLESDQDLLEKAEHLDWNAILSKKIPGFGEWLKKGEEKSDFEQWGNEL